jgi:hypothetical protein
MSSIIERKAGLMSLKIMVNLIPQYMLLDYWANYHRPPIDPTGQNVSFTTSARLSDAKPILIHHGSLE